ncbi:related to lipase family [Melanopsichium pennsylvanicum]|uniref:triacylglycerol lipase n=2 Tax=Melanopsichium pennsylvanicum TaxID=63383 RepID=A0AAJ5C425_9BASI|nr:related to lipase family [Melanopsichium pennsylvanicum 4]SNX83235.1 related to lipase family [Melanopsichium pennsylvanicum]
MGRTNDAQGFLAGLKGLFSKKNGIPIPAKDPFYFERSDNFSGLANGAILRSRQIEVVYFPGFDDPPLEAWQVAYKTKAQDGMTPQVTVLTILKPSTAALDADGKYRVMIYGAKCDSAGTNFRTSYALRAGNDDALGAASEQIFIAPCLDKGWITIVPDYESETCAFGAGYQSGYAFLDSIRAALNFEPLAIPKNQAGEFAAKITMWGYSGGALAVGWAAQLQPSYAPDLTKYLVGASMGGLPNNLKAIAEWTNKGICAGLIVGVVQGLANAYPDLQEWLDQHANKTGKAALQMALTKSFRVIMKDSAMKDVLGTYFDTPDLLTAALPASIIAENAMGTDELFPSVPCLIYQSLHDEVVPYKTTEDLVVAWSSQGACIDYVRDKLSAHVVLVFTGCPMAIRWMQDRFEGKPTKGQPGSPSVETVMTSLDTSDASLTLGKQRQRDMQTLLENQYKKPNRHWWT